jgi:hypothetical protein
MMLDAMIYDINLTRSSFVVRRSSLFCFYEFYQVRITEVPVQNNETRFNHEQRLVFKDL